MNIQKLETARKNYWMMLENLTFGSSAKLTTIHRIVCQIANLRSYFASKHVMSWNTTHGLYVKYTVPTDLLEFIFTHKNNSPLVTKRITNKCL